MQRLVVVALLLAGCGKHAAPVAGPDMAFVPAFAAHDKVDILFMIANFTTAPTRDELLNWFPTLWQTLAAHPASYHVGVINSDLGAGATTYFQCHPGGDGAKLRVAPDPMSTGVPAACAGFSLSGGVSFIDYDSAAGTSNVVGLSDVGTAFKCMGSVGDAGCAYQSHLEAPYRALHDPPVENAGFLRDDALLVVFILGDVDDCSVPPDSDLFDQSPESMQKYGPSNLFRCVQFGESCTTPPAPLDSSTAMGPFDDCKPLNMADGGKLIDVQKYIDYFTLPGGVKADPSDVILAAITPPPAPFGWEITMPCAFRTNAPECAVTTRSCASPTNPGLGGYAAIRIATVVDAALTSQRTSLCETSYEAAMQGLADKIIARLK